MEIHPPNFLESSNLQLEPSHHQYQGIPTSYKFTTYLRSSIMISNGMLLYLASSAFSSSIFSGVSQSSTANSTSTHLAIFFAEVVGASTRSNSTSASREAKYL